MQNDIQVLTARVVKAERRLRFGALSFICVAGFLLVGGWSSEQPDLGVTVEDGVVVAQGLVILDEEERPRIELGGGSQEQRSASMFGMIIRDIDGAERFGAGVTDQDSVILGMDAPAGVGAPMRDRLALLVTANGNASVRLIDNHTAVPVQMFTRVSGGGGLRLMQYNAQDQSLQSRDVVFEGELNPVDHDIGE